MPIYVDFRPTQVLQIFLTRDEGKPALRLVADDEEVHLLLTDMSLGILAEEMYHAWQSLKELGDADSGSTGG